MASFYGPSDRHFPSLSEQPHMRTPTPVVAATSWIALAALASAQTLPTARRASTEDFSPSGVELMAWMPHTEFVTNDTSDCWGYTSPSGREYGILCNVASTAFLEVTDPRNPVLVGDVPAPNSNWHDVKVFRDKAYVVSEGGGGIQVIDLSQIDSGQVTLLGAVDQPGIGNTHNVAIDEVSGFLYRCDGIGFSGLRIYDLNGPSGIPVFVTQWTQRSVHDAQVVTFEEGPNAGKQIGYLCTHQGSVDSVTLLDLTDKQNITILGTALYSGDVTSHQGWLSEDRRYFYFNDENDSSGPGQPTWIRVFDVQSLSNPFEVASYPGLVASADHNLYVKGDRLYAANYASGLWIFDLTDPLVPLEVGHFDTHPGDVSTGQDGLWSSYPFFESGTIVGSDEIRGFFVWREGPPAVAFEFPDGLPEQISAAGGILRVRIVESSPGELEPGSVEMHFTSGSSVLTQPLVQVAPDEYEAAFPAADCGSAWTYSFSARDSDGLSWESGNHGYSVLVAEQTTTLLTEDFEAASGWLLGVGGDTATSGVWTVGDPRGSSNEPFRDRTPTGTRCAYTGAGAILSTDGSQDIDGGKTTLSSPLLDLSAAVDPWCSYWSWFSNRSSAGGTVDDPLEISISNDGGQSWSLVEFVAPDSPRARGGWYRSVLRVRDFVEPTATMRLRVVASDLGGGSLVEAAFDDVEFFELVCADCDGDGISDAAELSAGTAFDFDGNGIPDECQPLSADVASVSWSAAGTQSLHLDAGSALAGQLYFLLGSFSGTQPGIPTAAGVFPLNFDSYFALSLAAPNQIPLADSFGILDGSGTAMATFTIPPGAVPGLVGLTAHHAFVALDALDLSVQLTSNAMPVFVEP